MVQMKPDRGLMDYQAFGLASADRTSTYQSVTTGSWLLLVPLIPIAAVSHGSVADG